MTDNRNTILAVILSGLVLIGWQYFFNIPQMEKQRAQQAQSELAKQAAQPGSPPGSPATPQAGAPSAPSAPGAAQPATAPPWSPAMPRSPPPRASRSTRPSHRQHRAEGRAHRRSGADPVPRHRRSQIAGDRAVLALGHADALLRRIRLGRRRGLDGAAARPEHAVAAGRLRQPCAEQPGDAEI